MADLVINTKTGPLEYHNVKLLLRDGSGDLHAGISHDIDDYDIEFAGVSVNGNHVDADEHYDRLKNKLYNAFEKHPELIPGYIFYDEEDIDDYEGVARDNMANSFSEIDNFWSQYNIKDALSDNSVLSALKDLKY